MCVCVCVCGEIGDFVGDGAKLGALKKIWLKHLALKEGSIYCTYKGKLTSVGTKNWRPHSGGWRLAVAGLHAAADELLTRAHIKELQVHGGCSDLRCGGVAVGLGRDGNDRVFTLPTAHPQGHAVQRTLEDLCARALIEQAQLRAARVDQHLCGLLK